MLVGRELTLVPKKLGALNISIYDEDLVDTPVAYCQLLVSPIASLELVTPVGLIEQDTSINMTVVAKDQQGVEFDED